MALIVAGSPVRSFGVASPEPKVAGITDGPLLIETACNQEPEVTQRGFHAFWHLKKLSKPDGKCYDLFVSNESTLVAMTRRLNHTVFRRLTRAVEATATGYPLLLIRACVSEARLNLA